MKRSNDFQDELKYCINMRRNTKPTIAYNYGVKYNDSFLERKVNYSKEYCKNQNEKLMEKAHIPLSSNCLKSSMSTYFHTNEISRNDYKQYEYLKPSNSLYSRDFTQKLSFKDSSLKKFDKDYSSIGLSEKRTTVENIGHLASRDTESDEYIISDRSYTGIDSSYLQNQNISLICKNSTLEGTQKATNNFLKSTQSVLNDTKTTVKDDYAKRTAWKGFRIFGYNKTKEDSNSPIDADNPNSDEETGIVQKNREQLNSSVLRTRENSFGHKGSFLSTSNYLCQTITDEEKNNGVNIVNLNPLSQCQSQAKFRNNSWNKNVPIKSSPKHSNMFMDKGRVQSVWYNNLLSYEPKI